MDFVLKKCDKQTVAAYFLALERFQKGSLQRRESTQVCLKDRRPCSDWFMTEGREGLSEMEDRR